MGTIERIERVESTKKGCVGWQKTCTPFQAAPDDLVYAQSNSRSTFA